jgi:flagellar biosynthesis protein FliQ
MAVTIVVAGPWMLKVIVTYTRAMIESIPSMIR